jgi:hypothetical protein
MIAEQSAAASLMNQKMPSETGTKESHNGRQSSRQSSMSNKDLLTKGYAMDGEVIGNVHENGDLLK